MHSTIASGGLAFIVASGHLSPWLAELIDFLLAATMLASQVTAQAETVACPLEPLNEGCRIPVGRQGFGNQQRLT
jgi:hypothetical protein